MTDSKLEIRVAKLEKLLNVTNEDLSEDDKYAAMVYALSNKIDDDCRKLVYDLRTSASNMTPNQAKAVLLALETAMDDFPQYWQNRFDHVIEKIKLDTSK